MSTLFSKIVKREIPAYIVAEDDKHLAFLDVFPLRKGHVLVIPKREEDDFFDLSDQEISDLMVFAKKVSKSIKKSFDCKKVGMTVIGLEVNHAHIHLIPINSIADMDFSQEKMKLTNEEFETICEQLRS